MLTLVLQIIGMFFGTTAVILHIVASKEEKNHHTKTCFHSPYKKWAKIFTILAVIFLACSYATILFNWKKEHKDRRNDALINVIHLSGILLPITIIELIVIFT